MYWNFFCVFGCADGLRNYGHALLADGYDVGMARRFDDQRGVRRMVGIVSVMIKLTEWRFGMSRADQEPLDVRSRVYLFLLKPDALQLLAYM